MINVTYNRRETTLTVKGHAQSAPKGEDLICAAVSALAYTLAAFCRERNAASTVRLAPGDAVVEADARADGIEDAYEFVRTGLQLLAVQTPRYVSVREAGERIAD